MAIGPYVANINSGIEAVLPRAPAKSIVSMNICCGKGLGFESSCMQMFYNFFLLAVIINFFRNNVFTLLQLIQF